MIFECHITVPISQAEAASRIAINEGWKTSAIERDPILGDDTHFYLTAHGHDFVLLQQKMNLAHFMLGAARVHVRRCKIEAIIIDQRFEDPVPDKAQQPALS